MVDETGFPSVSLKPINVTSIAKTSRAKNWGTFAIDVQSAQVDSMIHRAMQAVSGPSLHAFLETMASEYFTEEIIDRFAYEGDDKSGDWAPLKESTERIRQALGYPGANPVNERTQELLEFVAFHRGFAQGPNFAQMDVPGEAPSQSIEAKLRTAQQGTSINPLFPGAYTPPRPVLATDEGDMANLLRLLQLWVMQAVAGSFP